MQDQQALTDLLTKGAEILVMYAEAIRRERKHAELGLNHWLLALLRRHWSMAGSLVEGLDTTGLRKEIVEKLDAGDAGKPLPVAQLVADARSRFAANGGSKLNEKNLAVVILSSAGYKVRESGGPNQEQTGGSPTDGAAAGKVRPLKMPTLEKFGRDLVAEANAGKLNRIVARDEEISLVIETLCRRTKRNPVLVGPAGVGKTAIVEGLAKRIAAGDVPEPLRGVRLFMIQPSVLVAGADMAGEFEERMHKIIEEAGQEGIILFIDEVHSIIGAGGRTGSTDFASLLKPALARGELACVAATTDNEYRQFIEPDPALERRFQPIRVQELDRERTLEVLYSVRDELHRLRKVWVPDDVLKRLVEFAHQYLRNRYFPDKGVDLLEQCVAHAAAEGQTTVTIAEAQNVIQRMVGVPLALEERIGSLEKKLRQLALLSEEDIAALVNRLEVTMRGLDLRCERPNAVIMLTGEAAGSSDLLASTISECLFGSATRVLSIDFSRFTHEADVTMLIGAPPGYIGFSQSLPLHKVAQMPWCVLCCENIHVSHPRVLEVLRHGLEAGCIVDSTGKAIYLSDTVVLLTAQVEPGRSLQTPIGFGQHASGGNKCPGVEETLGPDFAPLVDLVCCRNERRGEGLRAWIRQNLLAELASRYRALGIDLNWDETLIEWFAALDGCDSQQDWEEKVDALITPVLVRELLGNQTDKGDRLIVKYLNGKIEIESLVENNAPSSGKSPVSGETEV